MNIFVTNRLGGRGGWETAFKFWFFTRCGKCWCASKMIGCYLMYICEPTAKSHFCQFNKNGRGNCESLWSKVKMCTSVWCRMLSWISPVVMERFLLSQASSGSSDLCGLKCSLPCAPSCTPGNYGRTGKGCLGIWLRDPAHHWVRSAASSFLTWAPGQMFWKLLISCSICSLNSSKYFMNSEEIRKE